MEILQGLDPVTLALYASVFTLTLAVWCMVVFGIAWRVSRDERKLRDRLSGSPGEEGKDTRVLRLWAEGQERMTWIARGTAGRSLGDKLRQVQLEAGWRTPAGMVVFLVLGVGLAAGLVATLATGRWMAGAFLVVAVPMVFSWYTTRRIQKRRVIFERQLVDGLDLCARALRAGHPLLGSFQLIAEEIREPVGSIFGEICQQQALGVGIEEALRQAAERAANPDMKLFAASLSINLRSGGNLAEVVRGLATVIRERIRLKRRFRVLIAQTQFSKRILIGMPILMFGVLNTLNPEYMDPMFTTVSGRFLLLTAALMLSIGWWIMNRMANLES